jgi:hypothetical protein
MMKHTITSMATAFVIANAAACLAGETNSLGILTHPHGPWTSVTNGISISVGPHDTNTFIDSDIVLRLYIKVRDGNPPEIIGNGFSVDIAIPENRDSARTKPHVGLHLTKDFTWTETALTNVYVASAATIKLSHVGPWGAEVSVPLKVNGKVITRTTGTCYFAVR